MKTNKISSINPLPQSVESLNYGKPHMQTFPPQLASPAMKNPRPKWPNLTQVIAAATEFDHQLSSPAHAIAYSEASTRELSA